MFRKTTAIATLAVAGITLLPGGAQADGVEAALKLQASAVVNSDKAVDLARENRRKAEQFVNRSEHQLKRAYAITLDEGKAAYAKFNAAAKAQGENLAAVVEKSRGELEREAADALAETARMQAGVMERQQSAEAADQSVSSDIAVVLDGQKLRDGVRRELETAKARLDETTAQLKRGGSWDVSREEAVGDDDGPIQVSVAAQAHASVGQGGSR